jgi:hypothetical protein
MNQQGNGYDGIGKKKSFWSWLGFGNRRQLDKSI